MATQALWLAMAGVLRAAVGTDEALPDGFWSAVLQTQARGVLLTVFAALLGFGLANLVRNTGRRARPSPSSTWWSSRTRCGSCVRTGTHS